MTSRITNAQFKGHIIDYIDKSDWKDLGKLKATLENRGYELTEHPTNPGPTSFIIGNTTEAAFQRAIFNNQKVVLDNGEMKTEVQWLDFELPVVLNKNPRRLCLDLIGMTLDGVPVICELKFSNKSKSNHPIYGVIELLMYYYYIRCNHDVLDVHHAGFKKFEWSYIANFESPKLLLVANKKYWDYWLNRIDKETFSSQIKYFWDKLNVNIECFSTDDEDFESQKGEYEKYTPVINSNRWMVVI